MAQLKTKDGTPKPEPTCYKWEAPNLGFTFELGGRKQLLALHSFLSHIEMKGEEEISFHYTYGVVRVIGRHLETIYELVKQHHIGVIRPSELNDPCRNEVEVTQIIFEDAQAAAIDSIYP
jgi:hypothetical protein